jgi:hypothetical protein
MEMNKFDVAKIGHFESLVDALIHSRMCYTRTDECDGCRTASLVLTLAMLTRRAEQRERNDE